VDSDKISNLNKYAESSMSFINAIRTVMQTYGYGPAEGSPASVDDAEPHYSEIVWQGPLHKQCDVHAQMSLLASIQYASLAIEDAGRRPAAFMVLVRAAFEAAASAHFLTSPKIGSITERARRGVNELLYGWFQDWKTVNDYYGYAEAENTLQHIDKILDKTSAYPELGQIRRVHEHRRPRAPYIGDERPTISSMIDDLFPTGKRFGRYLYSAVSSTAHSQPFGFILTGEQKVLPGGTIGLDQEVKLPLDKVASFVIAVLSAIWTAETSVFARYGWAFKDDADKANQAFNDCLEMLNP
jgi:hypothetical protein